MKLSVCIVNYNTQDDLARCLDALAVTLDPIALGAGLTFDDLVSFSGEDLDGINYLAVAFSRYQLQ